MHTNTEFYDQTNGAVIGWNAALKRSCEIQPTTAPERRTSEEITRLTGLLPLYPFAVPEGEVAVGPVSILVVDGVAYRDYATITIGEHEAQRAAWESEEAAAAEQARLQAFQQAAWGLPANLVEAYATFMAAVEQAVPAAMQAGATIDPTAITYQGLIAALNQLQGEEWIKTGNALQALWNVVVINTNKTPGEAYAMMPLMEYRRRNPPPEIEVE